MIDKQIVKTVLFLSSETRTLALKIIKCFEKLKLFFLLCIHIYYSNLNKKKNIKIYIKD